MSEVTAEIVAELVHAEVASIADDLVRDALSSRLQFPEHHLRNWDYGKEGEQFPCWTVARDPASDTAIVYSQCGFGPSSPWGLVQLNELWFGMDSGWFTRLEDAFVDSFMAADLPIWDVVGPDGCAVEQSLQMDMAFSKRDALEVRFGARTHHVVYRSRHPDGVR